MQMSEAAEVVQVTGETSANQKLAEGWTLLAMVPSTNKSGLADVAYVLGRPKQAIRAPLSSLVSKVPMKE